MSGPPPKPEPKQGPERGEMTREEREAAALRENLRRRKQQARERDARKPAPEEA